MRSTLITLALVGALGWLLWERQAEDGLAADELSGGRRGLEDARASLDACESTLARSEAALTRQRAEHEAREHALELAHGRAVEALGLRVAQAQVECLIGRAEAELQPGDAASELQAALSRLREEILQSRQRLEAARTELDQGEAERQRLQGELERLGVARVELERRLDRATEARDQHHWYAFKAESVLRVCGVGGREARGCADELTPALEAQEQAWLGCLRAGAAAPQLLALPRDQPPLRPAAALYARRREVVWLQLCDPTLPESTGGRP